jgi:hypothetical protein
MTTTALPLTNLAIENMVSAFSASLALDTQWRIQTNVFAIKLPGIRWSLPKISLPQIKGKQSTQQKTQPIYEDGNPNRNLMAKPSAGTTASKPTSQSQVRVRAAGSPVKIPQAPTLDELRQKRGMEPNVMGNEGWKRFPSRRRPGKDMETFLNMSKEMKRGSS